MAPESEHPVPWSLLPWFRIRVPLSTVMPSGPATTSCAESVRWPPFTTT